MRLRITTAIGFVLVSLGTPVEAGTGGAGQNDDIVARVGLDGVRGGGGTVDESEGGGGGGGYDDPCKGDWMPLPNGVTAPPMEGTITENGITYDLYARGVSCPGGNGIGIDVAYIQRVTAADLLPDLYEEVRRTVPEPEPEFLPLDPEFGWTYVKVGTDVRVSSSLEPVSATADLTLGPQYVWATATATPTAVTFEPGEPGGYTIHCTPEAAQAGYDPERLGACSYTYDNSSAVSVNGRTFTTTMSVEWAVTFESSSGGGGRPALTLTSSQDLAVAEIQALVTCTGPLPEQGGC